MSRSNPRTLPSAPNLGAIKNEVAVIDADTHVIDRAYDGFHRLSTLTVDNATAHYSYDVESRQSTVSNAFFTVGYAYTSDGWDAGHTVSLTNGVVLARTLTRDLYRRSLVTAITNSVDNVPISRLIYSYDEINRATSRNADTFDYNARSEVTFASISNTVANYAYDLIGNNQWTAVNGTTNTYTANSLNQYSQISVPSVPSVENLSYDLDGNLLTNGVFSYTYDAENRLVTACSNSVCVVSNTYDYMSRRVVKVTPEATHTFIYDGWNLIQETVATALGVSTNTYVWGKDISGTLQGAGGVGGLLAVQMGGAWYFPFSDANGNVTAYVDALGSVVAEYTYEAFGDTISQSGSMADTFTFRFSTKYFDKETGLYYYGRRFYSPDLHRWMNRDPIEEKDEMNLYMFVKNNSVGFIDPLGLTKVSINMYLENRQAELHNIIQDFLIMNVTVVEPPPKGNKINFIQLKKPTGSPWSIDAVKQYEPYYYETHALKTRTKKNKIGQDVIEFADSPTGIHLERIEFYLAIVEINRTCKI